eukprot:s411_g17.t2
MAQPWQGPSFEQAKRLEMSLLEADKEVKEAQRKRVETEQMLHEERQRADSAVQLHLEAGMKVEKLQQENDMCKDNLHQARSSPNTRLSDVQCCKAVEKTIDALQQDIKICKDDLHQEIEARMEAESRVQSLQQELRHKEKLLNAANTMVRNSGTETTAAKEKNVELEEKVSALQRSSKNDEEAILRLKDMCKKLKEQIDLVTFEKEDVLADRDRCLGRRVKMEEKLQEEQKRMEDQKKQMEEERMQMGQMMQQLQADLKAMALEKLKLEEEVNSRKASAGEEDGFIACGWDLAGAPIDTEDGGELNVVALAAASSGALRSPVAVKTEPSIWMSRTETRWPNTLPWLNPIFTETPIKSMRMLTPQVKVGPNVGQTPWIPFQNLFISWFAQLAWDSEQPRRILPGKMLYRSMDFLDRISETGRRSELRELAYFEDRIHRLCREDQWLMAECRSVEEELEALHIFGTGSPPSPAAALAKRALFRGESLQHDVGTSNSP